MLCASADDRRLDFHAPFVGGCSAADDFTSCRHRSPLSSLNAACDAASAGASFRLQSLHGDRLRNGSYNRHLHGELFDPLSSLWNQNGLFGGNQSGFGDLTVDGDGSFADFVAVLDRLRLPSLQHGGRNHDGFHHGLIRCARHGASHCSQPRGYDDWNLVLHLDRSGLTTLFSG